MNMGVYSDRQLKKLISSKVIEGESKERLLGNVQPSSIDLTLGSDVYSLPVSPDLPKGKILDDYFRQISNRQQRLDENEPVFLDRGKHYIVKLQESLCLPEYISSRSNPKSSIGRIDLHARLLTETGGTFDEIKAGYKGGLWLEIFPRSFDIKVRRGDALNQLRFFDNGTLPLNNLELQTLNRDLHIVNKSMRDCDSIYGNTLRMTASIGEGLVGYRAKQNSPPVDLSRRDLPKSKFFEPIYSEDSEVPGVSRVVIDPDSFYILNSREKIKIPPLTCAEMVDVDTQLGEFRGHYAGFFDPGFNAQAVLELRAFGGTFEIKDGRLISAINYYRMKEGPEVEYGGSGLESNYQGQEGPQLAKFFDMSK